MIYTVTTNPNIDYYMDLRAPLRVGGINRSGRELLAPNGWMFTINGVLSNLGVSTATLSDGDTLLWYEGSSKRS